MSDSPIGAWQVQIAAPSGNSFFHLFDADADMAMLATSGNAVVNGAVVLTGMPIGPARLAYVRASGGGATSVCSVWAWVESNSPETR